MCVFVHVRERGAAVDVRDSDAMASNEGDPDIMQILF